MGAARKQSEDRYMSIRDAADALDIAPQTVYARALDGHLETEIIAGRRLVTRESVDRFLAERALAAGRA